MRVSVERRAASRFLCFVESGRVFQSKVVFWWCGVVCLLAGVAGCSPAYNWREVRAASAPVVALMPCKPETAERSVPLLGPDSPPVTLSLWSCEAQGVRFALAAAPWPNGAEPGVVLQHWQQAAWSAVRQAPAPGQPVPPGWHMQNRPFAGVPHAWWAEGPGQDHRGGSLRTHLAWAVQPGWVVQAAVYSSRSEPEAVETFLSGVRFAQ
ncbi:MAG: hypothetical protein RJA09_2334 [Pseudomonadota bacterium]